MRINNHSKGVTVAIKGEFSDSTETDEDGYYELGGFPKESTPLLMRIDKEVMRFFPLKVFFSAFFAHWCGELLRISLLAV